VSTTAGSDTDTDTIATRRLTLVISGLGPGGAERVATTLANAWAARGAAVTLFTLDDGRTPPFYPLVPAVAHRPLAIAGASGSPMAAVANNLRRLRALRRAIRVSRPDVVLSFMDQTNVLTLLATRGLGLPVVVAEHNDPGSQPIGRVRGALRRLLYPRAATVAMLTERAAAAFPPSIRRRARVVPNPIVVAAVSPASRTGDDGRVLAAVGRLDDQKGFDLLLRAFAQVAPAHPWWRLTIRGEGPRRADLERLRDELGLADRVALPGATDRLHDELATADLFVLSSRYEGFPMALGEAMALGLPVVAFDCPTGPREIVTPGVDGVLVPPEDVPALAAALDRLMGDPAARARLAAAAPKVLDRFGLEPVLAIWDDILADADADGEAGTGR
jgi:glycosyltransferase involved in cell wall biosynthesis